MKADYQTLASALESRRFQHRLQLSSTCTALPCCMMMAATVGATAVTLLARNQGLTLVHFSAQPEPFHHSKHTVNNPLMHPKQPSPSPYICP